MTAEFPPGLWALCVSTFVYHMLLHNQHSRSYTLNTMRCSVSITLASATHPSPPVCIFRVLLSTVHPLKQRHLIGVHSPAKSFILFPFIFRTCSVERNMYNHYWLLLQVTPSESRPPNCNSTGGYLGFSVIKAAACGGRTTKTNKQDLLPTHHS